MENNLDRFFRENLSERQFEFKNEYWLEAEQLLEANRRRRRRAVIFWWFGGATLAVTVAMLTVFGGATNVKNQVVPTADKTENQAVANENADAGKAVTPALAAENGAAAAGLKNDSPGGKSSETKEISGSKSDSPGGKSLTRKAISSSKNASPKNFAAGKSPAKNGKPASDFTQISTAKNASSENDDRQNVPGKTTAAELAEAISGTTDPPSQSQMSEPETADNSATLRRQILDLQALPTTHNGVTGDFSRQLKVPGNLKNQPESTFRLGILAGQIFQAQADRGEQTILGWHAGLTLQRDLGKGFFAATGLEYLHRDGHFDASKSAERVNYRFGKEAELRILRPASLHYLVLPLKLGWQRGRHVFEAGGAPQFLLGLRGELGTLERVDNQKIFKPLQKGWLVEDGFKKWHFDVSLGYRYRVNRELSLGVSANYTLGGILRKGYVPPLLNGYVLREADEFFVSIKAVYFLW